MADLRTDLPRPSLKAALKLRCIYCGETPLLKKGSLIDFDYGCSRCSYRYEREEGYFTGATWMFNFPLTSVLAFLLVAALLFWTNLSSLALATICSGFTVLFGTLFYPLSQSLWLMFRAHNQAVGAGRERLRRSVLGCIFDLPKRFRSLTGTFSASSSKCL